MLGFFSYLQSKYRNRRNIIRYATISNDSINRGIKLRLDVPIQKKYLSIGHDCIVGGSFIFESKDGKVQIGNNCCILGCTFISHTSIKVGNYVHIAWGTCIYDHDSHSPNPILRRKDNSDELTCIRNGLNFVQNKDWSVVNSRPIKIEDDAWIGMNSVIFSGVTIGRGAIIGAGSYVRSNVPPYAVVIGNPAKIIGFTATPEELALMEGEMYGVDCRIPMKELEKNYKKYYLTRIKEIYNIQNL